MERKTVAAFVGEACREAAVLVMVFGPMYDIYESHLEGWILVESVLKWILYGSLIFASGIVLERKDYD